MRIGARLKQLFAGSEDGEDDDPSALREAEVVLLTQGPIAVEQLRAGGIEALAIDSFDPVTASQTHTRIMVRAADVAAARRVLVEAGLVPSRDGDDAEVVVVDPEEGEEEADPEAEEASQRAMSRLYVVADRLAGRPDDDELMFELDELREAVAGGPPPFGVDPRAWARLAELAAAVLAADDAEVGDVHAAAQALRDALHPLV